MYSNVFKASIFVLSLGCGCIYASDHLVPPTDEEYSKMPAYSGDELPPVIKQSGQVYGSIGPSTGGYSGSGFGGGFGYGQPGPSTKDWQTSGSIGSSTGGYSGSGFGGGFGYGQPGSPTKDWQTSGSVGPSTRPDSGSKPGDGANSQPVPPANDKPDLQTGPPTSLPEINGAGRPYIPDSAVTLIDFLPPVGCQADGKQDCVAWAFGYASMSCQIAQDRKKSPRLACDKFSPAFMYALMNKQKGGTLRITEALSFLRRTGCASYSNAPYTGKMDLDQAKDEAAVYKAHRHYTVSNINQVRALLNKKYPVCMVVRQDAEFHRPERTGSQGKIVTPEEYIYPCALNGTNDDYHLHAVTAVGYDDTRDAILIMNSHGTQWKDRGFCWVSYDQFATMGKGNWCHQTYVVEVKKNATSSLGVKSGMPATASRSMFADDDEDDEILYQLKDNKVYSLNAQKTISLPSWKISDVATNGSSLFARLESVSSSSPLQGRGPEVVMLRPNNVWSHISAGWRREAKVKMIAATPMSNLHFLTDNSQLFEYAGSQMKRIRFDDSDPVDVRAVSFTDYGPEELVVTTQDGSIYVRDGSNWEEM